jgi:hypothetical protein
MLTALLGPDEHEVAFGRVEAREMTASFGLLTDRRILWGHVALPEHVGVVVLETITSFLELEQAHRWGVRLEHGEMTQRVHVPEHRVLWWAWGNDDAERTFTESALWFSRRDTALARALHEALIASGASQGPTITIPKPERGQASIVPVLQTRSPWGVGPSG